MPSIIRVSRGRTAMAGGRQLTKPKLRAVPVRPAERTRRARRCRRKFLEFFPDGFRDSTYLETERAYKWDAHKRWEAELGRDELERLLSAQQYSEVAHRAVRIESRTNLLFSFEKMALRDAVSGDAGARRFAMGLVEWLYGAGPDAGRFDSWVDTIAGLPRRQTRVLTWPVATVFGFIAQPRTHLLFK